ncbi:MAG: hypothetical protein ACYS0G_05155 [Planctomycetota bacterium]|jgi:hypothetical protein
MTGSPPKPKPHRDARGRFVAGCPGGPGNPHGQQVARLRSALMQAVTAADVQAIARQLVTQAKDGSTTAAALLLNRLLGPCESLDLLERVEELEQRLGMSDHERPTAR